MNYTGISGAQLISADELRDMAICDIARVIRRNWTKIYFGAVPYLDAMHSLETVKDNFGCDSGKSIVAYFLGNAQTWRGAVAKAVKAELKKRIR